MPKWVRFTRRSPTGQGVTDAFTVGMSHESLKACRRALDSDAVSWQNNDKSLKVEGTQNEVTLTFALQGPPYGNQIVTLSGPNLSEFRSALNSLGVFGVN